MSERIAFADLTVSASDVEFGSLMLSNSVANIDSSSLSIRDSGCSGCSFAFHLPPFGVTSDPDWRRLNAGHKDANWKANPELLSPFLKTGNGFLRYEKSRENGYAENADYLFLG